MKLREGQPSHAMGPDKIPKDSAKGGGRRCWKGEDLGKIPSLGGDVNFKDQEKSRMAAASPGPHSRPDASPLLYIPMSHCCLYFNVQF